MLALTRRVGEVIVVGGNIRIHVTRIKGNQVRLAIEAPPDVRIDRGEVWERVAEAGFVCETGDGVARA
jgi:carbon storage regulator